MVGHLGFLPPKPEQISPVLTFGLEHKGGRPKGWWDVDDVTWRPLKGG